MTKLDAATRPPMRNLLLGLALAACGAPPEDSTAYLAGTSSGRSIVAGSTSGVASTSASSSASTSASTIASSSTSGASSSSSTSSSSSSGGTTTGGGTSSGGGGGVNSCGTDGGYTPNYTTGCEGICCAGLFPFAVEQTCYCLACLSGPLQGQCTSDADCCAGSTCAAPGPNQVKVCNQS